MSAGMDDKMNRSAALHAAIRSGHLEVVNRLLVPKFYLDDVEPTSVRTALQAATVCARPDVVRSLILAGADINEQNRAGRTAFLIAAYKRNAEVVSSLLSVGTECNIASKSG